jgi:hypothetical protein
MGQGSAWSRLKDSLTQTATQHEAEELREDTERVGATPIDQLGDRQVVDVCGSVRAVTLPPKASVPTLVVELYDGSRALNLVWLGRRSIAGIAPGTFLKAHGRVTRVRGVPTIYNPTYTIVPNRGR